MENIIYLFPTSIKITNYVENKKIENSLSVWDKVRFKYTFKAFIKELDLDNETDCLHIPAGYDFKYIKYNYPNYKIKDFRNMLNINNLPLENVELKYEPKDNIQKNAIKFLMGHGFSKECTQKLLSLNTGAGKTYVAINYIINSKRRPILFVDQIHLKEQWIESILKFTNITEDEIYVISGKDSIEKLLSMTQDERNKIKFYIAIYRTISNYLESLDDKFELNDFIRNKLKVSVKLFDEAHIEYMNIFYLDTYIDCESIYITATPKRSNPNENKVFQNMFKEVRRITSEINGEKIDKYHNILLFKLNSHPTNEDQINTMNKYGFSAIDYNYYILNKKYDYFSGILLKLIFKNILKNGEGLKKIAILVSLNKLVDRLYEDIKNKIIENNWNYKVSKFNGQTKNKEEALNADIIVTTDKSFGRAIDVNDLTVLMNLVPFSSPVINEQIIGRLRYIEGKEVYYLDFVDIGFPSSKGQLYYKKKIFNKKAKKYYEYNY